MSKNNMQSKQQTKVKPRSEVSKKTSTTKSSTEIKKLPTKTTATSRTSTTTKDEDKKITLTTKKTGQSTSLSRNAPGTSAKPTTTKQSITKPIKTRSLVETKAQLLKSSDSPVKSTAKKSVSRPPSSKPNLVMSTTHNVTVSSPPPKRKEVQIEHILEKEEPRIRSKSRTLRPEEVVILKENVVKPEIKVNKPLEKPVKVKEPVAFELIFDEKQGPSSSNQLKKTKSPTPSDSGPDYDDDFESYESDFETGSSSAEAVSVSSSLTESTSQDDRESPPNVENLDEESDKVTADEEEEESEITQYPITVIHREKEQERKLDSGHYDLHSKKRRTIESFDSLDTLANSEQLDSGISYENSIQTSTIEPGSFLYGGYAEFFTNPKITKRGVQIMSKIQLDTISFTLLDLKPIPYDTFMRLFGSTNTIQSATQTQENHMDSDCQTEETVLHSVWTQHPPQYDLNTIERFGLTPSCSGALSSDETTDLSSDEDPFERTITNLSKLRLKSSSLKSKATIRKPIDFDRLNAFLNTSSLIISRILSANSLKLHLETKDLPHHSKGFYNLNTIILNALKVIRIFSNSKFNIVLTVHESIDKVYQSDFSNLIMVWNTEDPSKPIRLLSIWSEVTHAEICNDCLDIIVCGLRDGSVAMWDLRETYSFCSKLDGHLTHFAVTHSIAPNWGGVDMGSFDLGAVVNVKSFRSPPKGFLSAQTFKSIQFASLNETGVLTIWTLVETGARSYDIPKASDSKFEYSSPWARVKLIQSAICDLREFIELGIGRPKSAFERTKSNFQRAIFDDEILKELGEAKNDTRFGIQGLRFTNLDCGTELIFVGTNRNFIVSCSKTLKMDRFRKINIIESGFLFPTAIKLLQNENYLVVGLSNGSVTILNCNQERTQKQQQLLHAGSLKSSQRPDTAASRLTSDFDFEIGKSCAIQNIIRNERRSMQNHVVEHEIRPDTATWIAAAVRDGKKPYEIRVFDEQVLLNGSVLRKDLVQSLEISSDGWTLFALSDGCVRVYDFYSENEVPFYGNASTTNTSICNLAISQCVGDSKTLILMNEKNDVQVHLLK